MIIIKQFVFIVFIILNNEVFLLEIKPFSNSNYANYEIIKKLNEEPFSEVYKVYNRDDDNIYIIERINLKGKNTKEIEDMKYEIEKLSYIDSEYVIKYYDYFIYEDTFNIVMEYCDGTNLKVFIELYRNANVPIQRSFILTFIYYISLGLQEIHKNDIIHKEIKPENIFITNDYKIKIGGFGIANRFNFKNKKYEAQINTPLYEAPEITKGLKYNNKIDIWSFGCILYELCSLKHYYFSKNKAINTEKYGEKFQNIIDIILIDDYNKRPSAKEILEVLDDDIKDIIGLFNGFKMDKLIREDPLLEKFILENSLFSILDQAILDIMKEGNFEKLINYLGEILSFLRGIFNNLFRYFHRSAIPALFGNVFKNQNFFGIKEKDKFIKDNMKIVRIILNDLLLDMFVFLDKKIIKEKTINIYNIKSFQRKAYLIEKELTSAKFIKKLKRKIIKRFNILLLGNTNVGKSTLINEFLKLPKNERAKESTGGPTKTIDFKSYNGSFNEISYSLYDTNGITNKGVDSIEFKIKNTEKEIKKRIKSKDPNQLIHCIWYCFQGTNIQPSDGEFIKKLISIYNKYSMPIIFVHTQTYSVSQSKTCKKGIKKYLSEIYSNELDVKSHLKNYVNILAREDSKDEEDDDEEEYKKDCMNSNSIKSFGLDELEKISRKEIQAKGLKSSYYEFIKQEIKPILINGAFRLFFTDNTLKILSSKAIKDINNYINTTLDLLDDKQLNLSKTIKERNKKSLYNLFDSFKKIKEDIINHFSDYLTINNLKDKYANNIEKVYNFKSENYKRNMDYHTYYKKIEELIFNKISKNSNEILYILTNLSFNNYVIQNIKLGIEEHFSDIEEKIINKIYQELFESFDIKNN